MGKTQIQKDISKMIAMTRDQIDIRMVMCLRSYEVKTTGWHPSCTCDAGRVPATVFDPFGGAGTVGLCAEELGRESFLLEINPEYCTMARERMDKQQPTLPLLSK